MEDLDFFPVSGLWAIEEKDFQLALNQFLAAPDAFFSEGPSKKQGFEMHGKTAIIPLRGPITKRDSWFSAFFGGVGLDTMAANLQAAAEDDSVKRIVLHIDSPGGSVDGLLDGMAAIKAIARRKTVVAQVDGLAASAAWFLASQATSISVGKTDLVGSVGVRMALVDSSEAFKGAGIKVIPIDTGEFKSAGMAGTEVTDRHIEHFQTIVDRTFAELSAAARKSRHNTAEDFAKMADGRVHLGKDAISIGLADDVRSLPETLSALESSGSKSVSAAKERIKLQKKS